jgi:hypothetical protein
VTRTPVIVVAAAIIAGVLLIQEILGYVLSLGVLYGAQQDGATNDFLGVFPRVAAESLIEVVLFAVGWFLSVRFIARVGSGDRWVRAVGRGLIASLIGIAVLVIGLTVVGFFGSLGPGDHPFGYAFDLTIYSTAFSNWAYGTAQYAFQPLLTWFPLSILGCVFLKLWLAAHPESVEAKDRASVSATP